MGRTTYLLGLLLTVLVPGLSAESLAQPSRQPAVRVVVNELLASNSRSVTDPQGHHEDWIELYNPVSVAVDLGGYYLTDDLSRPTKWQIPTDKPTATTIAARGYLMIWADGDITSPGLHAGFRLNDEGESVALFAPDGVTLKDSLPFDAQRVDISYGRCPDGGADLRFMAVPTPGAANVNLYEGIVEKPEASVPSSLCTGPLTVALTTTTEGATIHYTTDGSEPFTLSRGVPTGALYTGPIAVSKAMTLKAIASKPGWRQSDVAVVRYVFISPDLQRFTSPLPIAVIDTMGKGVSMSSTAAYTFVMDLGSEARAALIGPVDFSGPVAINVRGKSSSGFPKRQYHLETQDEQGDGRNVSILGLPPESDWVLQGMYSDKTLMRNVLAYQWSNELGCWAAHTCFIEMFLNSNDGVVTMDDYAGVYVFMEKIKISPNRVNITPIEPSDNVEPQISGGYIIKKDKLDGDDQTFNTSRGQNLIYTDPPGQQLTQLQKDWVRNYMNTFEAALYGPGFKDPAEGYAKFIDVGSFIDNHIVVELTKNIDGFRLSTYFSKDRNGKLSMGPVWDYDLSLGNANYLNGWIPTGWYNSQLGEGDYPYWRRLFEDPEFNIRYADRWFGLRRGLFTTERLLGIVEDYATLLDEPAKRNFEKWRILGVAVWPNWYVGKTYREEITWMKGWLRDRLQWLDGQIATEFAPAPPAFGQQGGQVDTGFALAMTGPGTIFYTLDGSDPRLLLGPIVPIIGSTLVPENASKRVLVPTQAIDDNWCGRGRFNDSAWTLVTGGRGGIGFFDRGSDYRPFITLNVRNQMLDLQSSCFVRIPFTFPRSVSDVVSVTLKVRYDDGFIAYLNGVEIARRNFTGTPAWNSAADAQNPQEVAVTLQSFKITNFKNVLHTGDNLLALHGMNVSASSADFLISAELAAEESVAVEIPPQGGMYSGPVPLTESGPVKARALIDLRWSALNEAVFAVGPVAESLRISELMYHPAPTTNSDDPNTEYIELMNIGNEAIGLNLVRFTDGIDFTFPSFQLAPSGYCLVVRDSAAFEAKYGSGLPVVGQYTGSLNNGGERIELHDAAGRVIHSFEYRDDWYDSTDGGGSSLTVRAPAAVDPNTLGDPANWRPSTHAGGSPGAPDLP